MSSSTKRKPFKLRLPEIDNDELIKRVSQHGSLKSWLKVMEAPPRHGENLWYGTVPEMYGADVAYWCKLMALMLGMDPSLSEDEIVSRGVPVDGEMGAGYKRYMLMMTWLHVKHMKNGWSRTVVGGLASEYAGISRTKLLLLDLPDDDIWTEDECLALKFVRASFEWEMTDDLWDAAAKAWGTKWILPALALLVHYYGYSLRFEVLGLDRAVGLRDDIPLGEFLGLPSKRS